MKTRSFLRLVIAVLTGLALVAPLAGTSEAKPHSSARFPDLIDLPDGFLPEGITIGPGPVAYFGSRADGDIYAADLRTGRGRVIAQGPDTAVAQAIGLKSDQRGLLYVAGGGSGTGRVVSTRTGEILAEYSFTAAPTFVNDVVLTKRMAWFTDSQRAQLYGIPLARRGRPAPATAIIRLPLTGDWAQTAGTTNANGIAQTPDKRALLVVKSDRGELYRVNRRTGVARLVDLGGYTATNGDGLLVEGRTLYVVQNQLNRVAVLRLNRAGTRGRLVDTLTDPDFDVPTTVASFGRWLYLPNARFTSPQLPTTEFSVVRIDRR